MKCFTENGLQHGLLRLSVMLWGQRHCGMHWGAESWWPHVRYRIHQIQLGCTVGSFLPVKRLGLEVQVLVFICRFMRRGRPRCVYHWTFPHVSVSVILIIEATGYCLFWSCPKCNNLKKSGGKEIILQVPFHLMHKEPWAVGHTVFHHGTWSKHNSAWISEW